MRCGECFRRDYRLIFTPVRDRLSDTPRIMPGKPAGYVQPQRCLAAVVAAILRGSGKIGRGAICVRGIDEEAVFSSSEDRIRASQASVAVAGPSIVSQQTSSGPESGDRAWVRRAAESLFSVLFPSDCRICGDPLLNISRLPVCPDCLARSTRFAGKVCSICGERVLSSYAVSDADGLRRCPVCRRVDRPFEPGGGVRQL